MDSHQQGRIALCCPQKTGSHKNTLDMEALTSFVSIYITFHYPFPLHTCIQQVCCYLYSIDSYVVCQPPCGQPICLPLRYPTHFVWFPVSTRNLHTTGGGGGAVVFYSTLHQRCRGAALKWDFSRPNFGDPLTLKGNPSG